MKKLLITFSGEKYEETTRRIVEDGPRLGADEVRVYDDRWLEEHPFRQANKWIFDHPGDKNGKRGAGCWYSFKPLIILDALSRLSDGDVLVYLDADTVPIADFSVLYDVAARDGAMFFKSQTHKQTTWCTGDCYAVMGQEPDATLDAGCARFLAVQRGPWVVAQLLMEWISYAVNPRATTFDPSRLAPDPPGFEEHRTEQAILTNLCHKHGFKLHRECDESGEESAEDRDLYPQLFQQTRQGSCQNGPGSRFRNV